MQRPFVLMAVLSRIGTPHFEQGTFWLTGLLAHLHILRLELINLA